MVPAKLAVRGNDTDFPGTPENKRMISAVFRNYAHKSRRIIAQDAHKNCRKFVKKCYLIVRDNLEVKSNKSKCRRKKITVIYPELETDIKT